MTGVLVLKIVLPIAALGGLLLVAHGCDQAGKPRQFTERQAAMVDSLRSAAPSRKELK